MSRNNSKVWIISKGRFSDIDLEPMVEGDVTGPCKEYEISDIGRYLMNPNSIEIKKKLIGGEIHYKQGSFKQIRKAFHKIWIRTKYFKSLESVKMSAAITPT